MAKDNSYKILVKLIKLSSYGEIEYTDTFKDNFPEIPEAVLYKNLQLLSNKGFIDDVFLDDEKHRFQCISILPQGYQCVELTQERKTTYTLSCIAIGIAILSLVVSVLQCFL